MSSPAHDYNPTQTKEKTTPPKDKGKRDRRDSEEEQIAVLEKAERRLKELKEERDKAKEERNKAEEKRDKYREACFDSEQDSERRIAYKQAWDDAEIALKNAEHGVETAQSAFDVQQRVYNRLIGMCSICYN